MADGNPYRPMENADLKQIEPDGRVGASERRTGVTIRFIHVVSYLPATMIVAGGILCAWAVYHSRQPRASSEVLMVIPGTSFLMLLAGLVLACCVYATRRDMKRWERVVLGAVATVGIGLFPTLLLLGI